MLRDARERLGKTLAAEETLAAEVATLGERPANEDKERERREEEMRLFRGGFLWVSIATLMVIAAITHQATFLGR